MSRAAGTTGRRGASFALVLALTIALVGLVMPARTALAASTTSTPVIVVLDASGSMNTADAPGPRIDAAKQAVDSLVDTLPAGAQVGLLVYGTSTGSSDAEKTAGCRDIKPIVPLGAVDKAAFKAAVAGITAHGYTPIGNALLAAAAMLPTEGPRSIVLVSDGEDTCAPPAPCDVARQLNGAGTDLTVHTVGFKVDPAARAQLTCIASATGGSYRETDQGAQLGPLLQNRVGLALRPYVALGTPVTGGTTALGAPTLKPGQYVDKFDTTSSANPDPTKAARAEKYYLVNLTPGESLYFSVTLAIPPVPVPDGQLARVVIALRSPDGNLCDSEVSSGVSDEGKIAPLTVVEMAGPTSTGYPCKQHSGQFVVDVAREGDALASQAVSGEVAVHIEPGADATGLPPAQESVMKQAAAPIGGTSTTIDGGSSFDNAPLLTPGTYIDNVVTGETRYYRVHVGFGQRLSYRVDLPPGLPIPSGTNIQLNGSLANPVRATAYGGATAGYDGTALSMDGSAAYLARYNNRDSLSTLARPYAIDGDYYLILDTTFTSASQIQIPMTFSVGLAGTKEAGPRYGVAAPSASAQAATTSASRHQTSALVWLVPSVVGLSLIALVVLLIVRRRRST